MIRMIKGTYGLVKNGTVEPMTKHSPAFSINAAARLSWWRLVWPCMRRSRKAPPQNTTA